MDGTLSSKESWPPGPPQNRGPSQQPKLIFTEISNLVGIEACLHQAISQTLIHHHVLTRSFSYHQHKLTLSRFSWEGDGAGRVGDETRTFSVMSMQKPLTTSINGIHNYFEMGL